MGGDLEKCATSELPLAQSEARDADKDHNFSRIAELTQCAAAQGAEIVSFHECCITGYTFLQTLSDAQLAALAEPVPGGPSTCRLIDLARQFRVALMAGLVESEGGKLYNTYVAVTADGFVQKHRKLHPFIHPGIAPGCDYSVFELCGVRCGILICYDNNLPENPRILTLMGADVIFAPHVTGGLPMPCREEARSIANCGKTAIAIRSLCGWNSWALKAADGSCAGCQLGLRERRLLYFQQSRGHRLRYDQAGQCDADRPYGRGHHRKLCLG